MGENQPRVEIIQVDKRMYIGYNENRNLTKGTKNGYTEDNLFTQKLWRQKGFVRT